MAIITCCEKCAERLEVTSWLNTAGAEREGVCRMCMPSRRTLVTPYEITPKNRSGGRRAGGAGPYGSRKDTRARWREPWRER